MADSIQIDPQTGERVPAKAGSVVPNVPSGAIQIDPQTGERVQPSAPPPPEQPGFFKSLGQQFGIDSDSLKSAQAEGAAHPISSSLKAIAAPFTGAYQEFKRSAGELGKGISEAKEGNPYGLASHAISAIPILGPAIDKAGEQAPAPTPGESFLGQVKDVATNPGAMGTVLGASLQAAPLVLGGVDAAFPGRATFAAIPKRSHAVAALRDIESKAANVPFQPAKTAPALTDYSSKLSAGGKGSVPLNKLNRELGQGPMMFPRARQFYTNVSDASHASPLRQLFESGRSRRLRATAGDVRTGMHQDLRDAAQTIGRGEDYANAIKEYARNARLRTALKAGGAIAGSALIRKLPFGHAVGQARQIVTGGQ